MPPSTGRSHTVPVPQPTSPAKQLHGGVHTPSTQVKPTEQVTPLQRSMHSPLTQCWPLGHTTDESHAARQVEVAVSQTAPGGQPPIWQSLARQSETPASVGVHTEPRGQPSSLPAHCATHTLA